MFRRKALIIAAIIVISVALGVVAYLYFRPVSHEAGTSTNTDQSGQQVDGSSTTKDRDDGSNDRTDQAPPPTYPVKVYFSKHPESDDDPSKVFAVTRTAPTIAVGRYAIEQLLAGPTDSERQAGYFSNVKVRNDASNCGGPDFVLTVENEVATLRLCRTFEAIGTISDGQAEQTIIATLRQFDTVEKIVILDKEGSCQFDLRGEDRCKAP